MMRLRTTLHGVDVSPRRIKANVAGMLRDGLVSILWAKLKPQQSLYITTYHLLPTGQHQPALTNPLSR